MPETQKLYIMKLSDDAYIPERGSTHAAGFDLKSAQNAIVKKRSKLLIKTDIAVKMPSNCYGRIAPRSGLALNHFIDVGAGVIDKDYTGNVGVLLFNHAEEDFIVKKGDKIAQLICEVIVYPELCEIECVDKTERGEHGFGSTG